jgi:hypothetical protein
MTSGHGPCASSFRAAVLGALVLSSAACTHERAPPEAPPRADVRAATQRGPVVHFSFETLDGKTFSTESAAGRLTVVGFVTTYDFASQAEARHLSAVLRRHTPRVNVGLLVLEQPDNRPLVDAFATTLGLPYPVAMADAATIAGQGPFAGLHHVPSVVILDKSGREAWRHVGLVEEHEIHAALRTLEATDGPPP